MTTFRVDRLKARMSAAGLNQHSLAVKARLHEDRVRNILRGRSRNPRADTVEALADALGVPPAWLLGRDDSTQATLYATESTDPMAIIPELDARGGRGELAVDQSGKVADWGFPAAWLIAITGADPRDIRVIEVQGNSMEPSLSPGDRVVIDRRQTTPSPPGYFVLWDGLGTVIKQIENAPNSNPPSVIVKSVNRDYDSYKLKNDEISIIGRIVAAIRQV